MILGINTDVLEDFPDDLTQCWPESMRPKDPKSDGPREYHHDVVYGFLAVMNAADIVAHVRFTGEHDFRCCAYMSGPICVALMQYAGDDCAECVEKRRMVVGYAIEPAYFPVLCSENIPPQGHMNVTGLIRPGPAVLERAGQKIPWTDAPLAVTGHAQSLQRSVETAVRTHMRNVGMYVDTVNHANT